MFFKTSRPSKYFFTKEVFFNLFSKVKYMILSYLKIEKKKYSYNDRIILKTLNYRKLCHYASIHKN